jgi:neutral ceramidase
MAILSCEDAVAPVCCRRRRPLVQTALFALLLCWPAPASAAPLRAGAARIDITPPVGYPMWGYGARRDAPSVGVRDPLQARAVVLEAGKARLAIVSLDLGRAPARASMQVIRARLSREAQVQTVFLVASHTHHGPVIELDDWPRADKPYVRRLEERLVDVVCQAAAALQPARLGVAAREVPLNRNRHSKRADKPIDRELIVVRLEDHHGTTIAHIVNFAAHATMTEAKLLEFSADYPGALAAGVERELGGCCLFLQGAAGDLSVNPSKRTDAAGFGRELAGSVIALSRTARCEAEQVAGLVSREHDFTFGKRFDLSNNPLLRAAYSLAFFPAIVDFYEREYREGVRPHLTTALVDGRIGLVGVSGEFFADHALHLKRRARLEHLLFLGYCNDYQQYFPTIQAVGEGGYGADTTVSPAEIGAGERMMDRALTDLLEMQGKIKAR